MGLDLPEVNADGTYGIPMPTVVIVDPTGVIRWIDVHPNYTTRTEVSDILAALFLASPAASQIHGAILPVDGGGTAT